MMRYHLNYYCIYISVYIPHTIRVFFSKTFSGLKGLKLANLMETFGLEFDDTHDALDDSIALLLLVRKARPKKGSTKWFANFLMEGYKPVCDYF